MLFLFVCLFVYHRSINFDKYFVTLCFSSLRGRRLKGKGKGVLGKGVLGARETRGAREEGGRVPLLPPPSREVSRPNSLPLAP